ncbi:haloacid dehalogenase [Sporomusaceae bacterium FL31]|nr:haloacid dehalogenase [Sporomusaceae bacterium FL31]GCE35196.1 haloacid dehalogenase [Sporomusaceae bacterium]
MDDDRTIPLSTIAVIKEIQAKGIYVTLASSRPFCSVTPYARQLGISLPLITHGGAYIADYTGTNIRLRQTLNLGASLAVIKVLEDYDYYIKVYCDDVLYVQEATRETIKYSQQFGVEYHALGRNQLTTLTESPIRIAVFDQPERIHHVRKLIQPWLTYFSISSDTDSGLEFVDCSVHKGQAVARVCAELGIPMAQVMAIGNEGNDIGMLKAAGYGIAMGNACPEIKQMASYITKSNNDFGVEHVLQKYILSTIK